jgi:hypothetical protein
MDGGSQQVKTELSRECLAHRNAADAVAELIERWGIDADTELSRQDGDDAAGDAALRRHADAEQP